MTIFKPLLAPLFWERPGNVPALTRLLQAYLVKAGPQIVQQGLLEVRPESPHVCLPQGIIVLLLLFLGGWQEEPVRIERGAGCAGDLPEAGGQQGA